MRAIISVSHKQGLTEFARGLAALGVEIYSTGGTRRHLEAAGLKAIDISQYTGFPEMMDGRVKTLHPKIFAGILCRHDHPQDMAGLKEHGIVPFELVVVNLYPFRQTIARPDVTYAEAVEQIDIGGPSMVRAAAKNHAFTAIVTNPSQYDRVLTELKGNKTTSIETRRQLAAEAYAHTAQYDQDISAWFARQLAPQDSAFPPRLYASLRKVDDLRYGENPHQGAAVYATEGGGTSASLVHAEKLHGKELSYNNLLDLDSALAMVRDWKAPAVVVIKHNNPCGAATHANLATATRSALEGDPLSAFGSVLGFNRTVDAAAAEVLAEPGRFVEAILAPDYDPAALKILTTRPSWKTNVRLLRQQPMQPSTPAWQLRALDGGFLAQEPDNRPDDESLWKVVTQSQVLDKLLSDLRFAWAMVRHVKSNAIVIGRDGALVGVGAGQMSRVDSVRISLEKAGDRSRGAVLASDAFFPFADSIDLAAAAGIAAIVQPGGSKRDDDVIQACNKLGIAMIFTQRRHFRH